MACYYHPKFTPYSDKPAGNEGQTDLVFCPHYSFPNRWRFSHDLVDYTIVERPNTRRLEGRNWSIRRVKIVNVPRNPKLYLLRNLKQSDLLQLEIDRLEIALMPANQVTSFTFSNLEVLSIGSIVTVDDNEQELPGVCSQVKFIAIRLRAVHLGPHLVEHVLLNVCFSVDLLETDLNTGPYLAGYSNLKELRWNQIKRHNFGSIFQIAEGGMCPKLKRLFLNLNRLEVTSYKPENDELEMLRELYEELKGRMRPAKHRAEAAISVFFNEVRLDFKRNFDDYDFGQPLVDLHRYNLAKDRLAVGNCQSIARVDYLKLPTTALFDPAEQGFNLAEFFFLYSHIRVVVLNHLANPDQPFEAAQFVRFLKGCKALISLQIVHSRFPTDLYDRLADEVEAVSTLDHFVLLEPEFEFGHQINVRFLRSLSYLRHLRTNLATKSTMIELAKRMAIGAVFSFEFSGAATDQYSHVCQIERLDGQEPQWSLLVQRRTQQQQSPTISQLYRQTGSLEDLENYFLVSANLQVSRHWLDPTIDITDLF